MRGRRVVVTRTAEQSIELVHLLRARGAEPVVVPLLAVQPEPTAVEHLRSLDPARFDWLVVSSPNAAEMYLAVHATVPARVAAVGSTTAAVLRAAGHTVALVPHRQRAEGVVAEFPAGVGQVLAVQAFDAEAVLAEGLRAKGWTVTAVRPYRMVTVVASADLAAEVRDADAVMFASGSAARAWVEVFGRTTPPLVVAIGPQTAAAVERAGLTVQVVADDHSLEGMVEALDRHLRCLP